MYTLSGTIQRLKKTLNKNTVKLYETSCMYCVNKTFLNTYTNLGIFKQKKKFYP